MVTNPKNILIIKPSSLGDVIHALPVLKILKKRFPEVRLSWFINEELSGLIEENPYIDEIFLFQRKQWKKWVSIPSNIIELIRLIMKIRKRRFDTVIDLQGLLRSGIISFLSGSSKRLGFENAREHSPLFYTDKIVLPDKKIHSVERYVYSVKTLGIEDEERDFTITIPGRDIDFVENFLRENKIGDINKMIIINPWARWKTKCWPIRYYISLIKKLKSKGYFPVLIGDEESKEKIEELKGVFSDPPAFFVGQSLKRLTGLVKKAGLMVTNDTGPMHIAAAVNTPVVAIFGPTDPCLTGPYGKGHIVIQKETGCNPCFQRECPKLHKCMHNITVDEVFKAVKEKLGEEESEEERFSSEQKCQDNIEGEKH